MKTRLTTPLLTAFASFAVAACGAIAPLPDPDPSAAAPPPDTETTTPAPPVTPGKPPKPASCGTGLVVPQCASLAPAPATSAAITAFVKDDAIPLRCGDPTNARWDLRSLVDAYGSQKIFAVGEVHGTNEIGIVSSLLFEELASKDLVDVLAFEMPMDLEPVFQHYVDGVKDAEAERMISYFAPNMFGSILTKTARDLVAKGKKIKIAAVDIPYGTEIAVDAIRAVAAKLTSQAQKDSVLATLPTVATDTPTPDELARVNAYFDHIAEKKAEICAELTADDCDRLDAMTHALWATATTYDQGDSQEWFRRREVAIYYNMRSKMAAPTNRMFLHMGAFHTNKHTASAGSRMANEYPLTKGQVFSVAPAYGDGSVIWYGEDMDLPGDPATILDALTQKPAHPFFVSTTRPSATCVGNPLGDEMESQVGAGGTRAQLYDGYIHYGQLTSEKHPTNATLTRDDDATSGGGGASGGIAQKLSAFRARSHAREAQGAGSVAKRGPAARR
jgi:hypothetical protein